MVKLNTTNQMVLEFERVLSPKSKSAVTMGSGHRTKAPLAERAFKKANPGWIIVYPWVSNLKLQHNPAEWMLVGKFKAIGPLGNERIVSVSIYKDGIRIF